MKYQGYEFSLTGMDISNGDERLSVQAWVWDIGSIDEIPQTGCDATLFPRGDDGEEIPCTLVHDGVIIDGKLFDSILIGNEWKAIVTFFPS